MASRPKALGNELSLVRLIGRLAARVPARDVVVGIGDDAAVLRLAGFQARLILSTDMMIEGSHFLRNLHPPRAVGYKALARALSDLAAMGAKPVACLLSLALPKDLDRRWLLEFLRGFTRASARWNVPLVGGDLGGAEQVMCDVVVVGQASPRHLLTRAGARPGDWIVVSGSLGGAALGLESRRGPAWKRHLYPEPRLQLGIALRPRLGARAAIDISDGLLIDLHRLCLASGVSAELSQHPPRFAGANLKQVLSGGEDYELLFAVPPNRRVPAQLCGVPLTVIGRFERGRPGRIRLLGRELEPAGWDHFGSVLATSTDAELGGFATGRSEVGQ